MIKDEKYKEYSLNILYICKYVYIYKYVLYNINHCNQTRKVKITNLNELLSYMAFRIFKPLVILFLRNSIPFQTASDWLKRIYIDTAFDHKEFRINPEKKQTKTRVAILTGLSRVEIDRVLKIEKPLEVSEQNWNRATKVLSAWSSDPRYKNQENQPNLLPIYGNNSFSSLVDSYSGGATMRSVLDDLLNVKSVEVIDEKVKLIRRDYTEPPDKKKLFNLDLYGKSTGELLNTLVYNDNESNNDKRRYQKLVFHMKIPDEKIPEAMDYIYKETDKLIINIDDLLSSLNKNNQSKNTSMIGLGAYYFEEANHEKQ
jgi:hypothetical protein